MEKYELSSVVPSFPGLLKWNLGTGHSKEC
jgi:hypothetical protein